jgi:hypothetical protein
MNELTIAHQTICNDYKGSMKRLYTLLGPREHKNHVNWGSGKK